MAAPKLGNDLPLFIRNKSSVNAFKKALKTHSFQEGVSQLICCFYSNRILNNNWSLFFNFRLIIFNKLLGAICK